MKTRLTLLGLGLLVSAEAFGQATFNGQFNDQAPLFPPSPVVGTNPFPPTNFGRTNLFTGTNRFLPGTGPGFTNPVTGVVEPTGLTNTVPPGANLPGQIPTLPGTPPATPGNPPPFQGVPPLPGDPIVTPQTPPGLPGNPIQTPQTPPGLPGNTPGLPGTPQPGLNNPGGAPPPGSFTVPPPQPMPPRPVQPAQPRLPLQR